MPLVVMMNVCDDGYDEQDQKNEDDDDLGRKRDEVLLIRET